MIDPIMVCMEMSKFCSKCVETKWAWLSGLECFYDPINRFGYQLLCGK